MLTDLLQKKYIRKTKLELDKCVEPQLLTMLTERPQVPCTTYTPYMTIWGIVLFPTPPSILAGVGFARVSPLTALLSLVASGTGTLEP